MAKRSIRRKSIEKMTLEDLIAETRRRRVKIERLNRRHTRFIAKAAEVAKEIVKMGGSVNGYSGNGNRARQKNEMTLVESLAKTLRNRTLSVTDAAAAVRTGGYRTNSNNFRTQVNIALIKSGLFKRVGRGEYTTK